MKVAILGFGQQGISALEYWQKQSDDITVCDQNETLIAPYGIGMSLGKNYLANLDRFDVLVRSPSIHPRDIIAANPDSPDILSKVTTNTNDFIRVCPTSKIIGVTGTKGKGTTSTYIARILEANGERVHLGGNIGTPPLELLKQTILPDDWVVLELANFQLIDLKYSPPIAVCLMVEEEHQDWHLSMEDYIQAKQQLFRWQTRQSTAIFYALNNISREVASISPGRELDYLGEKGAHVEDDKIVIDKTQVASVDDIQLLGRHNWQNVCAAVTAVWQVTHDTNATKRGIRSLTKMPFRIEFRREVNGVKFYDDSFAAAPGAAVAAIKAVPGTKVAILGGYDRNLDLEELAKAMKDNEEEIRQLLLIGESATRLAERLDAHGFTKYTHETSHEMKTIVRNAAAIAQKGDAVILTPGFPSFDMFKNFAVRGQNFNDAVEEL